MTDESNKRGSRDNTDLPYKPDDAQNYENAPRGHQGPGSVAMPGPGLGGAARVTASREEGQTAQSPEQLDQQTQQEDQRPRIVETGDDEMDQFYAEGNRVVDQDGEFSDLIGRKHAEMTGGQDLGDQDLSAFVRDDDPRPVFVETGDDEVDQFYAHDNRMVAQDTEFSNLLERRYADMTAENDLGDEGISGRGDNGI
ncbi:MAG: hypothetical protein AAGA74_02275 [Pseudomonadota bacterium]